jgi:WXG100 family type VII secretion target
MTISFDSGQHETFLSRLDAATTAIEGELDALHLEVGTLREAWSGVARDAYDAAQADWTASMTDLRDMLSQARSGAAEAGDRLRAAEDGVRSLWGS